MQTLQEGYLVPYPCSSYVPKYLMVASHFLYISDDSLGYTARGDPILIFTVLYDRLWTSRRHSRCIGDPINQIQICSAKNCNYCLRCPSLVGESGL